MSEEGLKPQQAATDGQLPRDVVTQPPCVDGEVDGRAYPDLG
jgi:hypothetical protein